MELHKASVVPKPNQASSASIPLHLQQNTCGPPLTGASADRTTVAERLPTTILLVTLGNDRRGEALLQPRWMIRAIGGWPGQRKI